MYNFTFINGGGFVTSELDPFPEPGFLAYDDNQKPKGIKYAGTDITQFVSQISGTDQIFTLQNGNYFIFHSYGISAGNNSTKPTGTVSLFLKDGTNVLGVGLEIGTSQWQYDDECRTLLSLYPNGSGANKVCTLFSYKAHGTSWQWVGNCYVAETTEQIERLKLFFDGIYEPPFVPDIEGYDGDFDTTSDEIGFPDLPSNDALDTGLIRAYSMPTNELNTFAEWLWTNDPFANIPKLFSEPMESIISLNMMPFDTVEPGQGLSLVKVGNIISLSKGYQITNQYKAIDFGAINIKEFFGNFLDYSPHTELSIFLPYIGIQKIDINDIMGSEIQLRYYIDVLTGNCVAMLKVHKDNLNSLMYNWQGNCSISVPFTSANYSNMIRNLIGLATTTVTAVATGGASAPLGVAVAGANTLSNSKVPITKGGSLSQSTGLLSYPAPYLILTRPNMSLPDNFDKYNGFKANITTSLSTCSGYTEIDEVHLDDFTGTDEEKTEIHNLLKKGVIL